MNIWVTGASGFTGQHLVQQLVEQGGSDVVGVYRSEPASVPAGARVELIDLADMPTLSERLAASPPDQVYHLAGLMPPAPAEVMWQSFVANSYQLLNALRPLQHKVKVLIAGSAAEYLSNDSGIFSETSDIGGVSDYGMAKSAQTLMCQRAAEQFGIDLVVARAFNILGPGMSTDFVVGQICAQLKAGTEELVLGNLESERDFLDVRDIASAYRAIMNSETRDPVVNVCSGEPTKIGDMVAMACEVFDRQPKVTSKFRNHGFDIDRAIGDASLLRDGYGWQPQISLRQSLADMRDAD